MSGDILDGTFRGNTIANCTGTGVSLYFAAAGSIEGNIVAGNAIGFDVGEIGDSLPRCNDVWNGGDRHGVEDPYGQDGNFSTDHHFCGGASEEPYRLRADSPCLPGNHPQGYDCGRIGAFDEGCPVVAVLADRVDRESAGEGRVVLGPPFPNPSSGAVRFSLVLKQPEWVRVEVFDAAGCRVATLADVEMSAGPHALSWIGEGKASGAYFLLAKTAGSAESRLLTLIR